MKKYNYLVSAIADGEQVSYTVRYVSKQWSNRIARKVGVSLFCAKRISIIELKEYIIK